MPSRASSAVMAVVAALLLAAAVAVGCGGGGLAPGGIPVGPGAGGSGSLSLEVDLGRGTLTTPAGPQAFPALRDTLVAQLQIDLLDPTTGIPGVPTTFFDPGDATGVVTVTIRDIPFGTYLLQVLALGEGEGNILGFFFSEVTIEPGAVARIRATVTPGQPSPTPTPVGSPSPSPVGSPSPSPSPSPTPNPSPGPEQQLNQILPGTDGPRIAANKAGNGVVVWNDDGDPPNIKGRRFSGSSLVGNEFQANPTTPGTLGQRPAISIDQLGRFAVGWARTDGSTFGTVLARLFSFDPASDPPPPLSGETPVESITGQSTVVGGLDQSMDADGNFIGVWHIAQVMSPFDSNVRGRQVDGNTGVLSPHFDVAADPTIPEQHPAVARARTTSGRFVVVWIENSGSGFGAPTATLRGRVYEPDGTPLGAGPFLVDGPGDMFSPIGVAMDSQGRFVVVWSKLGVNATSEVFARAFNPNPASTEGVDAGSIVQVNSVTDGGQDLPAVSLDENGRLVVVWRSSSASAPGAPDIYGRRFDLTLPGGTPTLTAFDTAEFLVNETTTGSDDAPVVAADAEGNFRAAWVHYPLTGGPEIRSRFFPWNFPAQ